MGLGRRVVGGIYTEGMDSEVINDSERDREGETIASTPRPGPTL